MYSYRSASIFCELRDVHITMKVNRKIKEILKMFTCLIVVVYFMRVGDYDDR